MVFFTDTAEPSDSCVCVPSPLLSSAGASTFSSRRGHDYQAFFLSKQVSGTVAPGSSVAQAYSTKSTMSDLRLDRVLAECGSTHTIGITATSVCSLFACGMDLKSDIWGPTVCIPVRSVMTQVDHVIPDQRTEAGGHLGRADVLKRTFTVHE